MTNKTIARKRKAIVSRARKVGSLGMGASLLLGGAPALANSGAFSANMGAMANNGAFQGVQHHILPVATLNHAAISNSGGHSANHASGSTISSFNAAHLHASGQQNAQTVPGWQHAGGLSAVSVPTAQKLSIGGGNLDLQSSSANVVLGAGMFNGAASASITVGGATQTFQPGQKVTAAEYVALTEVLGSGAQTLTVNAQGVAVGGDFSLNAAAIARAASIVIPANVLALDNIASSSAFSLRGDLLNYGSLLSYSSNSSVSSGTISAKDIINEAGGLISTQSQSTPIDLTIVATKSFANAGTVVAEGSLNLVAGSGNFANSGLVKSVGGNINFASTSDNTAINIASTGPGSFQALAGDINIRNASYVGGGNVNLSGGDYLSNNLNIYSGTGAINGSVGQVSGQLNSAAAVEHLQANTANLSLGTNTVDGDPTFVNNGDITISGVNTFTEDVLIVANGNIVSANGAQIVDHGHNVTLVAGVLPNSASPSTATVQTGTTGITTAGSIDFSSASNKGGDINFAVGAANTPIDTSGFNTNGGNVVLAAFANGSTGGAVRFDGASTINTATTFNNNVGGNGGNVSIYAGGAASVVQTINLGNITTSGGGNVATNTAGHGGAIIIATQQPTSADGTPISFNTTGDFVGNSIVGGTTISGANINISGTINTSYSSTTAPLGVTGGAVTLLAGGSLNAGAINTSGGNGVNAGGGQFTVGSAGGNAGSVSLQSGGSLTLNGDVTATGGAGGNSTGTAKGGAGGLGGGLGIQTSGNVSLKNANMSGGSGGNGGNVTNNPFASTGGAGGSGGLGGSLVVTSSGQTLAVGNVGLAGGAGGNGGTGGGIVTIGGGGVGGAGGSGGQLSINAPQLTGATVTGNISANGGSGGSGGNGGAGGQNGPSSGNAGAVGGAGGPGGVGGTIFFSAPGASLNVGSAYIFSAAGGNGGAGGVGGNGGAGNGPNGPFNIASGAGGNGGDGANAGTITENVQNLTGNFNLLGGTGGAGGAAGSIGVPQGVPGSAGQNGLKGSLSLTGSGVILNPIVANNISILAPAGSNGSVTIDASLTAGNALTLASDGTGTLTFNNAILTAQSFFLSSSSGDINTPLTVSSTGTANVTLNAPNGSVTSSFNAPVSIAGITAKNDVTLTGSTLSVASGSSITGGTVTINATQGSDLDIFLTNSTSSIVANTGDINISGATGRAVVVVNPGLIQSTTGNIAITSTAAATPSPDGIYAPVIITGGGTMQVGNGGTITITADPGAGNPALAKNSVQFAGSQTFIGNTVINATGPSGSVTVQSSAHITADNMLTINSSTLDYVGNASISANPLVLNAGSAAGTIAATGDLDLSTISSLTFEGSNLTILASGSITDGGKTLTISTASPGGAGGAVTIIGGFTFTSSPNAGPNYTNPDTSDTFVLGAASAGSNSVNLGHTSIDASGGTYGGAISVYSTGSIALGDVTSKGADRGGSVTILGNGVSVGAIDASSSAGIGGNALLSAGSASLIGAVYVTNGFVYGGSISVDTPTSNLLTHSINVDGVSAGGQINLNSGGATTFNLGSTAKSNVNGVVGTLSAAGPGGALYVDSVASGITNATPLNNFQKVQESIDGAGSLSLGSSLSKNTQLQEVYLSVNNGKLTESGSFTTNLLEAYLQNGSVGTTGAAFAVNAATIDAVVGGVLNIKDANTNMQITTYIAGGVAKLVGAGNVALNGETSSGSDLTVQAGKTGSIVITDYVDGTGKTSLIAGGTGSITSVGSPTITGASIVLTSKSGAIGDASNPLNFIAKTLTETSTGATYLIYQGSDALTFNGSNTTGAFSLTTSTDVTIAKPITKATSIDIDASGGIMTAKGALGGATTNSITIDGKGIVGSGVLTTKTAGSISLSTAGGGIGTGALGASTALKVNTGNLAVTQVGAGGVNIIDSAKVPVNLAASTSGVDFNLKTAQGVTLNGITAGGNINILASAGALTTAKNTSYTTGNGSILLEQASTAGTILLNTGTTISTHSSSGDGGNVVVSIGAPPATVAAGTTPTNVTVNNVSGGSAFFGNGITANANGGVNVINLKGSNVTFNIGRAKSTAITLDGDVTITADPVVTAAALTVAPVVGAPAIGVTRAAVAAPDSSATFAPVAVSTVNSANNSTAGAAIGQSNLAARSASLFAEPGWISQTELSTGEIPASISSDVDLGVKSKVSSILEMEEIGGFEESRGAQIISGVQSAPLIGAVSQQSLRTVHLSRGSVVFAPTRDTVVHTPAGDVNIAAHSLVLVMVTSQGTTAYNLHDNRSGAVSVVAAGKAVRLTPGSVVAVTTAHSFAEVNPAQMVGYCNLSERQLGGGYRAFAGQFSLTQAMAAVMPLRQLVAADNANAKKLAAKVLKTSAILQQVNGGKYEQVVRPLATAWAN